MVQLLVAWNQRQSELSYLVDVVSTENQGSVSGTFAMPHPGPGPLLIHLHCKNEPPFNTSLPPPPPCLKTKGKPWLTLPTSPCRVTLAFYLELHGSHAYSRPSSPSILPTPSATFSCTQLYPRIRPHCTRSSLSHTDKWECPFITR